VDQVSGKEILKKGQRKEGIAREKNQTSKGRGEIYSRSEGKKRGDRGPGGRGTGKGRGILPVSIIESIPCSRPG